MSITEKPNVYFVSTSTFLLYHSEDVARLKKLRMFPCDVSNGEASNTFSVSQILPEQVAVLRDYGLVNIISSVCDEPCSSHTSSTEAFSEKSQVESLWSKAEMIVKGRKAKELKRKTVGGGKSAAAYKVTIKEKDKFEASKEEVEEVYLELIEKAKNKPSPQATIELQAVNDRPSNCENNLPDYILFPDCIRFLERKKVVHDLWLKGFYLTSGLKFGCHFLMYKRNPNEVHSSYMVHCGGQKGLCEFDALRRVSTQTKKILIIAKAAPDAATPEYSMLTRFTGLEEFDDNVSKRSRDETSPTL